MKDKVFIVSFIAFMLFLLVIFGLILSSDIPAEPDEQLRERVPAGIVYEDARSSKWPKVRAEHIRKNPECAACGSRSDLNVHHIKPFKRNPELELDPNNLITFCRSHHYWIGHKGNWSKENPNCRQDAKKFKESLVPLPQ